MYNCTIRRNKTKKEIYSVIENALPYAMEKVMEHGQSIALNSKVGSKNKDLIQYKIEKKGQYVEGKLFTNFKHSAFLEFGTGKLADGTLPHIGHTKTFFLSDMKYWWIPPDLSEDGEWHLAFAQAPKPFMRPTAFELEDSAKEIIAKEIVEAIDKS